MKTLNITLTDREYKHLIRAKNGMNWNAALRIWANAYRRANGEDVKEYGKGKKR